MVSSNTYYEVREYYPESTVHFSIVGDNVGFTKFATHEDAAMVKASWLEDGRGPVRIAKVTVIEEVEDD